MRLQGEKYHPPLEVSVQAEFQRSRMNKRQEYLRVRVENGMAVPFNNQSSGVLKSASWANGLVVIPPETLINQGDPVKFIPFSELLN